MIKKPEKNETIIKGLIGFLIVSVCLWCLYDLSGSEDEIISSAHGNEAMMVLALSLIYICIIVVTFGGVCIIRETLNRRLHPEQYVYCKKCKGIIKKVKDVKFCDDCFYDIKRAIKREGLLKHKKDFLKQKKRKK